MYTKYGMYDEKKLRIGIHRAGMDIWPLKGTAFVISVATVPGVTKP